MNKWWRSIGRPITMILSTESFMTPQKNNNTDRICMNNRNIMVKIMTKDSHHHMSTESHWFWIIKSHFHRAYKPWTRKNRTERRNTNSNISYKMSMGRGTLRSRTNTRRLSRTECMTVDFWMRSRRSLISSRIGTTLQIG